ncbi:hypothetical protein FACS1894189_0850 [Planctomycetales bacterium]|nr:hypothetical protein FACS1894189_0850 [Planctomycetales bacterium]
MKVITFAIIPFTLSKILLTLIVIRLTPAMNVNAFTYNLLTFTMKVNAFSITPNQKGKENAENFLRSNNGL